MSERHSPAFTYPLRAAPLLRNGLWAVLILEAVLLALWAVEGAGHGRWQLLRMAGAVAIWGGCAVWGWQAWRAMPVGVLQWDGRVWTWQGPGASSVLAGSVQVVLDGQSLLLLRWPGSAQRGQRFWLQRDWAPHAWDDVRRAVYSPARPP